MSNEFPPDDLTVLCHLWQGVFITHVTDGTDGKEKWRLESGLPASETGPQASCRTAMYMIVDTDLAAAVSRGIQQVNG